MNEQLRNMIDTLPEKPGVYRYFNKEGTIIYVGKAKKLKRRVSSYFNKSHDSVKTNMLVRNIDHMEYTVVNTEHEALLLENNLIKRYQPKYNILLKDGKTYPSICITHETFPRIFKTRNIIRNGSEYYGPYSNTYTLDLVLKLIKDIYPIRICNLPMTQDGVNRGKYKLCLQYHIHKCMAPCEALESAEDYRKHIDAARKIIKGDAQELIQLLEADMMKLAEELKFEEAQQIKNKIDKLKDFQSKTVIVNSTIKEMDVFGYEEDENNAYISILKVHNGSIVQSKTIEYHKQLDEPQEEILSTGILDLRESLGSCCKHCLVPFMPWSDDEEDIEYRIPERGDGRKLLELAQLNVKQYRADRMKQAEKLNPDQRMTRILGALQKMMGLKEMPIHIECFDNSNISGTNAVAGCVVFKKAKPSKKDYRTYNIKTVEGPDDYASMKEVVYRRYKRMKEEGSPLPNLVIADGGIGQMEVMRQAIEDELGLQIPIAGLAKNDKHRTQELLFGFPPKVIGMKVTDETFKFLTQVQDEVHRFAIAFHRNKRSKKQIASELDQIPGIGEKSKKLLIKHFKSIKRARMASEEELCNILGKQRGSTIYKYFLTNK